MHLDGRAHDRFARENHFAFNHTVKGFRFSHLQKFRGQQ